MEKTLERTNRTIISLLRNLLVYIVLFVLIIIAQLIIPDFMGPKNLSNVIKLASFTGVAAIGQTLVILLGGIDMSISNVITFSNIISAQIMMGLDANIPLATISVIMMGALVGLTNAIGVVYLKIPPMIMTLGVGTMIQGFALLYSKGAPKGNSAPFIRYLVNDTVIGGVASWIVAIWIVLSIIIIILLNKTIFGRKVYAVGMNRNAAKFSGINANKVILISYVASAIFSAIAGVMLVGYTGTAQAESGATYSMDTIVAVVVGGTAMTGGKGGYTGTIIGAIIMVILDSILTVINIPKSGRMVFQGLIILGMVFVYGREDKKY